MSINVFNFPLDNLYILSGKYYQKLGEVWDHETKDFKVLYKPLYSCGSKTGSFEAHHIATSTFERWERKFVKVTSIGDIANPNELQSYLVSNNCIGELSCGNPNLPGSSVIMPKNIRVASAKIMVSVEDIPSSTSVLLGQSDSGYGSRSLTPYFSFHFDVKWKELILSGKKIATTRVLNSNKGEPALLSLVDHVNSSKGGVVVKCLCGGSDYTPCEMFGNVRVSSVEVRSVQNLSIELANMEQFSTVREFINCLHTYYPNLTPHDNVHVFHFTLE